MSSSRRQTWYRCHPNHHLLMGSIWHAPHRTLPSVLLAVYHRGPFPTCASATNATASRFPHPPLARPLWGSAGSCPGPCWYLRVPSSLLPIAFQTQPASRRRTFQAPLLPSSPQPHLPTAPQAASRPALPFLAKAASSSHFLV